jgi:hypothetical protein
MGELEGLQEMNQALLMKVRELDADGRVDDVIV